MKYLLVAVLATFVCLVAACTIDPVRPQEVYEATATARAEIALLPTVTPTPQPEPTPCDAIKGNIGADGRKLYHVRGESPNFDQVVISKPGEQYFCTIKQAEAAGFAKAGN